MVLPQPLSSPQVPNTQPFHHPPRSADQVYVSRPESLANEGRSRCLKTSSPRWKLGWTRLSVWLRPASHTNCDFFPGALSLSLSSLSALEPLEVSGNQSLKQTIQRARDLGKNKTKLRDVTSWAEQWPFYARAQEPPFRGIQRLPPSGLLEAVPMSL